MGTTSCNSSSSATGYTGCISNYPTDTILSIGIIVGIVPGSLAGISVIICVIVVTCLIAKKFNSSSTLFPPLPLDSANGYYQPTSRKNYEKRIHGMKSSSEPPSDFRAMTNDDPYEKISLLCFSLNTNGKKQ